jgi:hypothetical protein
MLNKQVAWWHDAVTSLCQGVAIAIVVVAAGYALSLAIPAIGVAIGLAGTILAGGIVATGTLASWVVPVAAGGLGIAGTGAGAFVLVQIVKMARREPFYWILPIIGVFSTFVTDLNKELYHLPGIPQIAYGAATALAFVGGGIAFRKSGWGYKLVGVTLVVLPTMLVILRAVNNHPSSNVTGMLFSIDTNTWWSVGLLIVLSLAVILLSYAVRDVTDAE